jgi:hypothetical protein
MYMPNFPDGFDRLVSFDAETTGKRTPDAEFIRKQPSGTSRKAAWLPSGLGQCADQLAELAKSI